MLPRGRGAQVLWSGACCTWTWPAWTWTRCVWVMAIIVTLVSRRVAQGSSGQLTQAVAGRDNQSLWLGLFGALGWGHRLAAAL